MKRLHPANDNLMDRTRAVWKPRVGHDVSPEGARQIIENATGFFAILAEWSRAGLRVPTNDTTKPATSDTGEVSDEL